MSGKMIMFIGLPASGKTTYWKRHFRGTEVIRLSLDTFQKMVTGRDHSPAFMPIAKVWIDWTQEYLLRDGHTILIDSVLLTKGIRSKLVRMAQSCGASVEVYWFDTPLETCMDRNRCRDRVVPDDVMQRMNAQFDLPEDAEEQFDVLWRVEGDGEKYSVKTLTGE